MARVLRLPCCRVLLPHSSSSIEISGADRLKHRFYQQSLARQLVDDGERVRNCLRVPIPVRKSVDVWYSPSVEKAHYKNLQLCGSVWHCPVCAAKISERRREELSVATARWEAQGGSVLMLTFTFRHKRGDDLVSILDRFIDAQRRFKAGAAWDRLRERYGWMESVRALEVTHGENGWHPHGHMLVFMAWKLDRELLEALTVDLKARWQSCLEGYGLDAEWEWGLDVKDRAAEVADYVAKMGCSTLDDFVERYGRLPRGSHWTDAHEVAKSVVKKARTEAGRTPMQLLEDYGEGDAQAGVLWAEYSRVFKGRHQLEWSSREFKKQLVGSDKSDEELVNEPTEEAVLLVSLTFDQWKVIVGNDARAEALIVASSGDREKFWKWFEDFEPP
jgi:hypothetical protein